MNTMMHALTFSRFGGPEVLEYRQMPRPEPKAGEVLVHTRSIGLNYADIYRRKGNYHLAGEPPYIPGYEAAGVVAESRSSLFAVGTRVAFADVAFANAEYVLVPEEHLIALPDEVTFDEAASLLLQGLTAQYLCEDTHAVREGEHVLVHAASGGVGQLLVQLCKARGARVTGLSRSQEKLEIIRDCGADQAMLLQEGWVQQLQDGPLGLADVSYDSVGRTLQDSFRATRDKGHVVFYGMSGGDPEAVDPRMLMDRSMRLSGGDLWSYLSSNEERQRRSDALFQDLLTGIIQLRDPVRFALSEGREAHRYLESGKSSSKVLLLPD